MLLYVLAMHESPRTRRDFLRIAGAATALTLLGCAAGKKTREELVSAPIPLQTNALVKAVLSPPSSELPQEYEWMHDVPVDIQKVAIYSESPYLIVSARDMHVFPLQERIFEYLKLAQQNGVIPVGLEGISGRIDGRRIEDLVAKYQDFETLKSALAKRFGGVPLDGYSADHAADPVRLLDAHMPARGYVQLMHDTGARLELVEGVDDMRMWSESMLSLCFRLNAYKINDLREQTGSSDTPELIALLDQVQLEIVAKLGFVPELYTELPYVEERSQRATENFLALLDRSGHRSGTLIFGKKHSPAIESILDARRISHIAIAASRR